MKKSLDDIVPLNPLPQQTKKRRKKVRKLNDIVVEKLVSSPITSVADCDVEDINALRESNGLPLAKKKTIKEALTEKNAKENRELCLRSGQLADKGKGYLQKVARGTDGVPKNLTVLDEVRREFAFRYATEYRKNKEWAEIFNVTPVTIRNWLQREDVAQYIHKVRSDRNSLMTERLLNLEKKAYAKLDALLDLDLEDVDNAQLVHSTIKDVLSLMGADMTGKGSGTTTPAVQIFNSNTNKSNQVTEVSNPTELKSEIEDLHRQLAELNILEGAFEEVQ